MADLSGTDDTSLDLNTTQESQDEQPSQNGDQPKERKRSRSPVDRDKKRERSSSGTREPKSRRRSRAGAGGKEDKRVLITNIPFELTWQKLKDLIREKLGDSAVKRVEIFSDENGKSKGAGLADMRDYDMATKAIEVLNKHVVSGRKIIVRELTEKDIRRYMPSQMGVGNMGGGGMGGGGGGILGGGMGMGGGMGGDMMGAGNAVNPQLLQSLGIEGPVTNSVFVANLDFRVTWKKLKEIFQMAGNVVRAEIKEDKDGKSRGMGTVQFELPFEAVQAISMFNGQTLYDRAMTVRMDKLNDSIPPQQPRLPSGLKGIGMGLGMGGAPIHGQGGQMGNMGMGGMGSGMGSGMSNMGGMGNMGMGGGMGNMGGGNMGMGSGMGNMGGMGGGMSNMGGGGMGNMGGGMGSGMGMSGGMGGMGMSNMGMGSGMGGNMNNMGMGGDIGGMGNMGSGMGGLSDMIGMGGGSSGLGDSMGSVMSGMGGSGSYMGSSGLGDSGRYGSRDGGRRDRSRDRDRGDRRGDRGRDYGRDRDGRGDGGSRVRAGQEGCSVIVRNLPFSVDWQQLKERFRDVGDVKFAEIKMDNGKSKGWGTVRFNSPTDASRAVNLMDGALVEGREISVQVYV